MAEFKAEVINDFVKEKGISSVIEFGSGDGNQLTYFKFDSYIGFDISQKAIDWCRDLFKEDASKTFHLADEYSDQKADMTMSLEVLFHLLEDEVFEDYMQRLFQASKKYVVIFSSNETYKSIINAPHMRHRKFSDWIDKNASQFKLVKEVPNRVVKQSFLKIPQANFYLYEKKGA